MGYCGPQQDVISVVLKVNTMNINKILLCTFAAAAVCACQTEKMVVETPAVPDYKVSFIANTESDNASKAVIGTNASGKIQTFWENGDKVTVYSEGNGSSNTKQYAFETSLTSASASAEFGYTGDDFVSGDHYLAIYPHVTSGRTANFAATRMAQVDVPISQKLVAGGFDRSAAIMLAYSDNLNTMNFKNAVALVKFKVADENIKSGSITAKAANIVGRFRGDVKLNEDGSYYTELAEYSSGATNAPSPILNFSVEGGAALVAGTDYYVAVRPVALEEGFSVYLDGEFIKTYYITEFKRNTIYDLGTLSLPEKEEGETEQMTLEFDFTTANNFVEGEGLNTWPRTDKSTGNSGPGIDMECLYNLNGTQYSFRLVESANADNSRIYWNSNGYITLANVGRYIGLPIIDGYKLVKVDCLHGTKASTSGRGLSVSSDLGATTTTSGTIVSGGEQKITKSTQDHLVFNLSGTMPGTRYYLYCSKSGIGFSKITLTYEADSDVKRNSVRIGTYNLRYINSTDAEENQWENRKGRVKQSILDNDFDVFAVQECSGGIRTYIESELSSVYSGNYFNPYAGNSSKEEYIVLLYKKDKFTLSDWHTFWLADDISKIGSISAPNDASGEYTYYRGGCCAVLTEKATNKKIFVISTHGCLGAEYRAKYAAIYAEVEKKYNTNGYPAFLLGDMNSRPTDAASVEYRKYWNDVYRSVAPDMITGPFATYNAFDLDRDLNADTKRLDYIYYRNATPLNYVCNSKKYDSLYASDHLPVYADMVIK